MGLLKGASALRLPPELRVGRLPTADLCIDHAKISREQAVIRWTGTQWRLRDLGSLNGTFVKGVRLRPGEEVVLARGDLLNFGGLGDWELASEAAPEAEARCGEEQRQAWAGALVIGEAVLRRLAEGWVLEQNGRKEPVHDRHIALIEGKLWTFRLPEMLPATAAEEEAGEAAPPRPELPMSLRLEGEEEKVHAQLMYENQNLDLKTRAPNRVLWLLAKERLRDRRRGVAEGDAGWVRVEDAAEHLGISANTWYVWLWRLRAALEEAQVPDADRLVERRFTGEVRLGIHRIELIEHS